MQNIVVFKIYVQGVLEETLIFQGRFLKIMNISRDIPYNSGFFKEDSIKFEYFKEDSLTF